MEHSYDDTVSNLLIVSQDDTQLQSLHTVMGGSEVGTGDSTSVSADQLTLPSPSYNTVRLLPNSYTDAVRRPRNSPRDTSSYLRSRLERSNAIRRGVPSSDQSNLLQQLGELRSQDGNSPHSPMRSDSNHSPRNASSSHAGPDLLPTNSNQHSSAESQRLVHWFDNLMAELSQSSNNTTALHRLDNLDQEGHPRSLLEHAVLEACLGEANRRQRALADSVLGDSDHRNLGVESQSEAQPQNNPQESHSLHSDTRETRTDTLTHLERELLSDFSNLYITDSANSIGENQVYASEHVHSDIDSHSGHSSNHEEHSDNENFYDDNFEDYDEHYIASGEGNTSEDAFPSAEEDLEVQELGVGEEIEMDNRFVASIDPADHDFSGNTVIDNRWHRDSDRHGMFTVVDSEDEHYSQLTANWQSDGENNDHGGCD